MRGLFSPIISILLLGVAALGAFLWFVFNGLPMGSGQVVEAQRIAYSDIAKWTDDKLADFLPAFVRSCDRIERLPNDRPMGGRRDPKFGALGGTAGDWKEISGTTLQR